MKKLVSLLTAALLLAVLPAALAEGLTLEGAVQAGRTLSITAPYSGTCVVPVMAGIRDGWTFGSVRVSTTHSPPRMIPSFMDARTSPVSPPIRIRNFPGHTEDARSNSICAALTM